MNGFAKEPTSICSKNDEKPCIDKLKEWDLDKYFVFNSINWEPKGQRIKDTVESMNLRPSVTDSEVNNLLLIGFISFPIFTMYL